MLTIRIYWSNPFFRRDTISGFLHPQVRNPKYRDIVGDLRCFQFFDRPRIRDPRNFFLMRQLRSFLREFNPDVVHLLAFHPWLIFMKRILSRYPLVVTVHDPRKHAGDISSKIIPGSENFFYKSAARGSLLWAR